MRDNTQKRSQEACI